MPYIINRKGLKVRYSPTKISEKITQVFNHIYNEKGAVYYRSEIIYLTANIIERLKDKFGEGDKVKWELEGIEECILAELREYRKNPEILRVYLLLFPKIEKKEVKEFTIEEITDSYKNDSFLHQSFEIDPVWSIQVDNIVEEVEDFEKEEMEDFGVLIKPAPPKTSAKKEVKKKFLEKKRSDWFNWFKKIAVETNYSINIPLLEKIASKEDKSYSFNSEGWYNFWKETIFEAMVYDPRMFDLLRLLDNKKNLSNMIGRDWLEGSGLNQNSLERLRENPILTHRESKDLYKLLWKKNIERLLFSDKLYEPIKTLNLDKIANFLMPERDMLVSWHGVQILRSGGCLWKIPNGYHWNTNLFSNLSTKDNAVEPIQWVWMRLALSVSLLEENPEEYIKKYYDLFSQLIILPSESMLRQACMKAPDYLDDMATRLDDKFETIYESITTAAIGTKWTGTVSIDWSKVRSVGSPINEGVRHSKGVMQFSKLLNEAMVAQNRVGEDKPITMTLPIWHKEILKFIKEKEHILPRLRGVINISDLFMQKLLKNEDWVLFDPAFFPEVNNKGGYLRAYERFEELKKNNPESIYKINSIKLWNRILKGLKEGMYTIVFEDSNKAFDIFPDLAPSVTGFDGVGCFPLPLSNSKRKTLPWVSWPSAAVNLIHCIKNNGEPDIDKLSNYVYLALRLLDNALTITANKEDKETLIYRSVCLGNIGFTEALNEIIYNKEKYSSDENVVEKWISGLSEAWGLAVLSADQSLARERGVAPVYEKALQYTRFYSPEKSMDNLRKDRNGSLNFSLDKKNEVWDRITENAKKKGYRFVNRSCLAPFQNMSILGGVSQGGVGSVNPLSLVEDEKGVKRWVPNPLIIKKSVKEPENLSRWNLCLKYPTTPRMWDKSIKNLLKPDSESWRSMLDMAKRIRPWSDQGISLTLPVGLSTDQLNLLITESWWSGLNVIRFEKNNYKQKINMENGKEDFDEYD